MKKMSEGKLLFLLMTACLLLLPSVTISAEDNGWARDPFADGDSDPVKVVPEDDHAAAETARETVLEVKGIYKNSVGRFIAIINGKEYAAGDNIGEEKIKKIDQLGVVLLENGITRRIGLFGPNVEWGNYDE